MQVEVFVDFLFQSDFVGYNELLFRNVLFCRYVFFCHQIEKEVFWVEFFLQIFFDVLISSIFEIIN
jgi:hypothetical protein